MNYKSYKKCFYQIIIIIIPVHLLLYFNVGAQNLIQNYSFELHDSCPANLSDFERVYFWQKLENTPDYFYTCDPFHIMGIPYNYFGYQYAHSGCAYAGFYSIDKDYSTYREYIQTQLLSTLSIGTKYYISFNISLFNGWAHSKLSATNKIGCKLSTISFTTATDNSPATDNYATFYTDSIISDTLNWVKISGSFIADSAYNYISFGNFFDSLHTQYIIFTGAPFIESYYYIDDVCLSTDSLTCVNVTDTCHAASPLGVANLQANDLVVYPNPFSDFLNAENKNNNEELELVLRDLDGRVLWREQFTDKWKRDLSYLANGMYFYEVRKQKKLFKAGKVVKV